MINFKQTSQYPQILTIFQSDFCKTRDIYLACDHVDYTNTDQTFYSFYVLDHDDTIVSIDATYITCGYTCFDRQNSSLNNHECHARECSITYRHHIVNNDKPNLLKLLEQNVLTNVIKIESYFECICCSEYGLGKCIFAYTSKGRKIMMYANNMQYVTFLDAKLAYFKVNITNHKNVTTIQQQVGSNDIKFVPSGYCNVVFKQEYSHITIKYHESAHIYEVQTKYHNVLVDHFSLLKCFEEGIPKYFKDDYYHQLEIVRDNKKFDKINIIYED